MKSLLAFAALIVSWTSAFPQPTAVKVWPHGAPGALINSSYREDTVFTETGAPRIRHVTDPELYAYLPEGGGPARSAIIICPGGAYGRLALDHEGHAPARWLQQAGIAGIVLKYRLPADEIMKDRSIGPLQDVQEAIRMVRRKAAEWNIDPHKIGVMGFSAGGHLAVSASTLYAYKAYDPADTVSARPDFSLLIYGVLSMKQSLVHGNTRRNLLGDSPDSAVVQLFSAEEQVTSQTPPAFLVHSANDPSVPVAASVAYFSALKEHAVPAELHIYETGGHGYGLGKVDGTECAWPEACKEWMKMHGFLP